MLDHEYSVGDIDLDIHVKTKSLVKAKDVGGGGILGIGNLKKKA